MHFPDLPCGDITIEGISFSKHCNNTATKKSPVIKMGCKKEREHCQKYNYMYIVVPAQKRKKRKRDNRKNPVLEEGGKREYVLAFMFVTLPTSQVERSQLKALAL